MAITGMQSVFKYKTVKGPLHKVPALLKLILLLPLSVLYMSLSLHMLITGIIVVFLVSFFLGFTINEQLTDLKPAAIYAGLMYVISVFSNIIVVLTESTLTALPQVLSYISFTEVFFPRKEYIQIALRLTLIIQLSAIFFRTTSSLEIRECLFRGSSRFTENISLFLNFIPEVFSIWTSINLAWKARSGNKGFNRIRTTVFILITLSMEKASGKAKALEARKI